MASAVYDRDIAAVRAGLSETIFTTSWAEGRAMTMDQAVGCTLERMNS